MPSLLTPDGLKNYLHQKVSREDKLLLVLGSFDAPCRMQDIKRRASEAGLPIPEKWNPSAILGRSEGLAIRTAKGWELSDAGRQHLKALGVAKISASAVQVALDLHKHLQNISDPDTRAFVQEAIECYEHGFYRSAVIMSWIAAVHVLQQQVLAHYLTAFNVEATRVNANWKQAKTTDDLSLMREVDFLDRIAALSVIGKNTKAELKQCLDLRNACGHPNSFKLGPNTVARHFEILLLNVFEKF